MKFFATSLIRQLDQYTIEHEPISSIDLMERAADKLYRQFIGHYTHLHPVCIIAGQGNNGGDALALGRKLLHAGYAVSVILINPTTLSPDCETNKQRLLDEFPTALNTLQQQFIAPKISDDTVIIDGLFGSGLSRPLTGIFAETVNWINQSGCEVVAIDIPSGLQGEENLLDSKLLIVKATITYTLQFPKLAFLLPENADFVGKWEIIDIGIHPKVIAQTASNYSYLEQEDIRNQIKKRSKFSHKGSFGHALIIAGNNGMAGASVLAAKAALRSGAGLVTVFGPECNRIIVQTAIPEAIFKTTLTATANYNVIAIGPGIGTQAENAEILKDILSQINKSCILDADALNIISQQNDLLKLVPENSIITPHPKEFDRLFGISDSTIQRILKAQEKAKKHKIYIILKGAHTLIATPSGQLIFNSTGNPGMSTAGSGDVLTGILAGLLAQGYSAEETATTGVYLHGRAGDIALERESEESLIAGDIISCLGKAFKSLKD